MTTYTWHGGSGSFTDPSHWAPEGVPGASAQAQDVADIGNYDDVVYPKLNHETGDTITFPTGTFSLSALNIGDDIVLLPGYFGTTAGMAISEVGVSTTIAANQTFENDGLLKFLPGHVASADSGGMGFDPNTITATDGLATLRNDALMDMELGSSLTLSGITLVNNGEFDIRGADFSTELPVQGTGVINIYDGTEDHPLVFFQAHSHVTLQDVSATQTVNLEPTSDGSRPQIHLELNQSFAGLLSGFVPGDVITIHGIASQSVTYKPNSDGTPGGVLVTTSVPQPYGGASQVSLRLANSPQNAQFTASPDGNGNTVLTVNTSVSQPSVPSLNGARITSASGSPITDARGTIWTLVDGGAKGLQIAANGAVDQATANVVLLEYLNGSLVQENSYNNWYSEPGKNGPWSQIPAPQPSASGTRVNAAGGEIIDANENVYTLVDGGSKGLQIAVNGAGDAVTANVTTLEYLNGNIVQQNSYGNWYSEPGPNGPWTQVSNPNDTSQAGDGSAGGGTQNGNGSGSPSNGGANGGSGGNGTTIINVTNITTVINNNILVTGDVADLHSVPSVAAQLGGTPGHLSVQIDGQTLNAGSASQVSFLDGTMDYDAASAAAQIVRLYNAALGRGPDAVGLAGWAAQLQSGASLAAIAQGFLSSAEFQARFPGAQQSETAFVNQLYQNVLHRQGEASGVQAWTQMLQGGASQAAVLVGFSESAENKADTAATFNAGVWVPDEQAASVARLYYTVLDRAPDAAGLAGWVAPLKDGQTTLQAEASAFVQSAEFQHVYGSLTDSQFVTTLYQNVLHRAPDASGLASWTQALSSGAATRGQVVVGFSESQEHVVQMASVIDVHGIVVSG